MQACQDRRAMGRETGLRSGRATWPKRRDPLFSADGGGADRTSTVNAYSNRVLREDDSDNGNNPCDKRGFHEKGMDGKKGLMLFSRLRVQAAFLFLASRLLMLEILRRQS